MSAVHEKKVAAIRAQIRDLQSRRVEIEGAPISRAERAELLRQHFDGLASQHQRALRHQLSLFGHGEIGRPFSVAGGPTLDLAPMLAAVLGADALLTALAPHLAALPEGIGATEKAQQLAELDAELLRLAHAEQDVIDAAEAVGEPVAYRADADPAIVLRIRSSAR